MARRWGHRGIVLLGAAATVVGSLLLVAGPAAAASTSALHGGLVGLDLKSPHSKLAVEIYGAVVALAVLTFLISRIRRAVARPRAHRLETTPTTTTRPSKRLTAKAGRVLTLTVIDQGASSLSNFALAGIVAHYSHAHQLGIFAIVTSTYIIAQGLVRSLTSDCLLTRAETDDDFMARFERAGYLSAFIAAVAVSIIVLGVAAALPHDFALPLVVFAACFPFMALQDFSRFVGISRHQPGYSIALDTAWIVLFIAAFVVLKHQGHTSLPWLVGEWTGAGGAVGLYTTHNRLSLVHVRDQLAFWVHSESAIGWRFASQFMLTTSWAYSILYLLAFVLSVAAIGIFKLGQLVLGPLTVLSQGLQSAMVAMAAKQFKDDSSKALRFIFAIGTGTAIVTMLWTLLIYFLPVHTLTKALGPTWPQTRPIVIFIGLGFVMGGWSGAAAAGLRALRAAKETLRLAIVMLPFLITPCMVGAAIDGLHGAAVGSVIAQASAAILGWYVLLRVAHKRTAAPDDSAGMAEAAPAFAPL